METNKLTRRELMIIDLCKEGYAGKTIADQLHISLNTVESHLVHARQKTDTRNTVQLVALALSRGLIAPLCLLLIVCQLSLLSCSGSDIASRQPARSRTRINQRVGRTGRNGSTPLRAA